MCDRLEQDPDFNFLLQQFADSPDDYDDQGRILDVVKHRYVLTLMYEQLARRPRVANAPETLGLVWMRYPAIDNGDLTLPDEVVRFNDLILRPQDRINPEDWRILLHMYLDCTVRSRNAVFICGTGPKAMSIIPGTPSVWKPAGGFIRSKIQLARCRSRLSATIVGPNCFAVLLGSTPSQMAESRKVLVEGVLHAMWTTLQKRNLLALGKIYDNGWKSSQKTQLNLAQVELQLYRKAWLCPVTHRPLPYTFKGILSLSGRESSTLQG